MKKLFALIVLAAFLIACQQGKKQYFSDGPEIDMIKKMDQSFAAGDLTAIRNNYADTAKIWFNTWGDENAISVDTLMARAQAARSNYDEVKMSDPLIYEMVELDNGNRWVHRWFRWDIKHKNGKSYSYNSHASFMVMGGKIRAAGYVFNALPGYLATQDSSAAK